MDESKKTDIETAITRLDQKIDSAIAQSRQTHSELISQWNAAKVKASEGFVLFSVVVSAALLTYHHAIAPAIKTALISPGQKIIESIAPNLDKPVQGGDRVGSYTISPRDFGMHLHPILGKWMQHNGVDIGVSGGLPENSQLYTPGLGGKTKVECKLQKNGAGLYAILAPENPSDRRFLAMHLNRCAFKIGESGYLRPGQVFALTGGDPAKGAKAGRSTGPHLHWSEKQKDEHGNFNYENPTFGFLYQALHGDFPLPAVKIKGGSKNAK